MISTTTNSQPPKTVTTKLALQVAAKDYNTESLAANYHSFDFEQTSSSGDAAMFQIHERTLQSLDLTGKVVLEIGCAGGEHLKPLLNRGAAQLIGIDQSPQFIDIARKAFSGSNSTTAQFLAADMHALPLEDNSVDILISRHCLHYSEDVRSIAAELSRVLRPGGQFIGVFNVVEMKSESRYLEGPIASERWFPVFIDFGDRQFSARNCAASSQEWFDALEACGFEIGFAKQFDGNDKWNNTKVQYKHHALANLMTQTVHATLATTRG